MKIYVIEFIYDYLCQYGFSFDKETALNKAKKLNEKAKVSNKYFVTEYTVKNPKDFCCFD